MFIEIKEVTGALIILNTDRIIYLQKRMSSWFIKCTNQCDCNISSEEFDKNVKPKLVEYGKLMDRFKLSSEMESKKNDTIDAIFDESKIKDMALVESTHESFGQKIEEAISKGTDIDKMSGKYKSWK